MEVQIKNKIAILDLDSIAFAIGNPNKILDEFGVPKRTEDNSKYLYIDKTEDELITSANEIMNIILLNGEFTHYIGFIKGSNTIKDKLELYPQYKQNRPKESPKWWNFVKHYLVSEWNANTVDNLETDDACYIARINTPNSYIVCIDSDLINLEGTSYNWKKDEWITTTKEEASYRFWCDMICGTHNNVKGIPGKGIKYTEKCLEEASNTGYTYPSIVLINYITHFGEELGIEEFYKTYKCLKIKDKDPNLDLSKIKLNLVAPKEVF